MKKSFVLVTILLALASFKEVESIGKNSKVNKAVHFQSTGDYIEVAHSPSLNPQQFTIEFWLRVCEARERDIFPIQTILQKRGFEFAESYSIDIGDWGFDFSIGAECGGIGLKVANVIEATRWYHIAVIQQSDSLKMYLNGQLAETKANSYTANTSTPLRIGESLDGPETYMGLHGDLDDMRIWNYPRSQEKILSDMNKELSGNEPGLLAYWDFNNLTDTTITDKSPNGNNGIIFGDTELVNSDAPIGYSLHPPIGLRAWGEGQSIKIAWKSRGGDATHYAIYRGDSPCFWMGHLISHAKVL